jgi:hypothetical protein
LMDTQQEFAGCLFLEEDEAAAQVSSWCLEMVISGPAFRPGSLEHVQWPTNLIEWGKLILFISNAWIVWEWELGNLFSLLHFDRLKLRLHNKISGPVTERKYSVGSQLPSIIQISHPWPPHGLAWRHLSLMTVVQ